MAKRRGKTKYAVDWKRLSLVLGGLVAVIAIAVGLAFWLGRPSPDQMTMTTENQMTQAPGETTAPEGAADPVSAETPLPEPVAPISAPDPTEIPSKLPVVSRHKSPEGKYLALTIDDCYQTKNVRRILELGDQYNAKFTFFPVGQAIKNDPELWKEVYDRGHEIENHTYNHTKLTTLKDDDDIIAEITRLNDAVDKAMGAHYQMHFFRPPEGAGMKAEKLHKLLIGLGYRAVAS